MNRRPRPWSRFPAQAGWILLAAIALMAPPAGAQAAAEPDLQKVIQETQQFSDDDDLLTLVWYLPPELWRVSFEATGNVTGDAVDDMMGVVEPYLTVAVVEGSVGPFGAAKFKDEEVVAKTLRLVDGDGKEYEPLPRDEISPDLQNLLHAIKPVLAGMMGPMGESFHFYAFPARNADGEMIADAIQPGGFTLKVNDRSFDWRLPLGSLLEPKRCPVDGERLNGAWTYCPWHGEKLESGAAGEAPPEPSPEAPPTEG